MRKWISGLLMATVAFVAVLGSPLTSSAETVQVSTVATVGGQVRVDGADWTVAHDATVGTAYTFVATPTAAGYVFAGWSIVGSAQIIDNPYNWGTSTFAFSAASVVTANFVTAGTATLTVAVSPEGGGDVYSETDPDNPVVGALTVALGQYEMIAVPAKGFAFSSWTVTGGVSVFNAANPDGIISVTADGTLTANFVAVSTAKLTLASNPVNGGTIDPVVGDYTVTGGTWYWVEATAAEGFEFQSWSMTANGRIFNIFNTHAEFYLLGDATLTANFVAVTSATLTVASSPANGGTVNLATGAYNIGEWYDIAATPATGFKFQSWSITENGRVRDINERGGYSNYVYLTGNATLAANFVPDTSALAKLVVSATPLAGLGTFSIDNEALLPGDYYLKVGQWYQVEATSTGDFTGDYKAYVFDEWTTSGAVNLRIVNGDATHSPTYYILLTGDATLTANFTLVSTVDVTMAVSPADSGYLWPADIGIRKIPSNTWFPIEAYALVGYKFVSWSSSTPDITILDESNPYTQMFATAAGTVTANFEAATPAQMTVATNIPGAGYISGYTGFRNIYQPGTYAVNIGEKNYLYATPASGYKFKQVTATGAATVYYDTSDHYTDQSVYVVLTGDATVTFEYEASSLADFTMAVTPIGKAETYVVPGTYQFTVGQRYYVNAATIYEGYQYVKWTATGGVVLDADNSNEYGAYFDFTAAGTLTLELVAVPMGTLTLSANPTCAPGGYDIPRGISKSTNHYYNSGFMIADATLVINYDVKGKGKVKSKSKKGSPYIDLPYWRPIEQGAQKLYIGKSYLIKVYPVDAYKFTQWTSSSTVQIKKVTEFKDYWYLGDLEYGKDAPDWYYLTITGDGSLEADFAERGTVTLGVTCNPVDTGLLTYTDNQKYPYDLGATNTLYAGLWYSVKALSTAGLYFQNITVTNGNVDVAYYLDDVPEPILPSLVNVSKGADIDSAVSAAATAGNYFYIRVNTNAAIEAVYSTTPLVLATLTMAQVSTNIATINPLTGDHKVRMGEPYDVSATMASGYYFSHWEANPSANVIFANRTSAATTVKLLGDATVTPIFTESAPGRLGVLTMDINVRNDNDPLKPKDNIKVSSYFDTKEALPDISGGIAISVDGWMQTITTWTEMDGNKYTYKDKNVKLVIDVAKNTIQLNVKKLDLYSMITPEDGIDVAIMISATNKRYIGNVDMEEKTNWDYTAPKGLATTPKIGKFKATHIASSKPGAKDKDSFSIVGDGLVKPTGFDKTTIPTVKIDAAEWIISVADVKNSGEKYTYFSPKEDTSDYYLALNFATGKKWSYKASKDNNGSKLNRNGTIVVTIIYGALGEQSVRLEGTDADTGKPLVVIKSKLSYSRYIYIPEK